MKPLFTKEEFKNAKPNFLLPCECKVCENVFYKTKHALQNNNGRTHEYCSKKCYSLASITKVNVICKQCGSEFFKKKVLQ